MPSFRDLATALRALDPDVVLLVSPPATHRTLAEEALAAGCHVLVEKPLAPTMADARAVAAAATRAGRLAMVAQNYRFRRQSRALQRLVADGTLGRLHGISISFARDMRVFRVSPRDWRARMRQPLLLDMAVHHVDMLRSIAGREVDAVDARGWSVPDSPFRHDVTVAAVLQLAGGPPVGYHGTWAAVGRETSWNGDWELVGEKARATWSGGPQHPMRSRVVLEAFGSAPRRVGLPRLAAVDRHGVLQELRRAILAGARPECDAADNLRSLAVVLALARSSEERRAVAVQEVLAS